MVVDVEAGAEAEVCAGDMVWKYIGIAEELMKRTELRRYWILVYKSNLECD